MIKSQFVVSVCAMLSMLLLFSCDNDTVVGSGLLSGEELNVEYIDDIEIRARTVMGDSVLTFSANNDDLTTYLMGRLDDSYFGVSESEIFLTSGMTGAAQLPNFTDVTTDQIDSVVLVLSIDPSGIYGDTLASYDFEVFRMQEQIWDRDSIYSHESFDFDMTPIGSLQDFVYNSQDTLELRENGDTILRAPQIRITLDNLIGEEIVDWVQVSADTTALTDEGFSGILNGLRITATPNGSAMMGVDLSETAYETEVTELAIYYERDTFVNRKYGFSAGIVKTSHFNNDYTGTPVQEAIDAGFSSTDEYIYVQSMNGANIEFDVSEVQSQAGKLLNHAELELTVPNIMGEDLDLYTPIAILLASSRDDDGDLVIIEDILEVDVPPFVEEFEEGGLTYHRYTLEMTRYIQDVIKSNEIGNNLTISAILKPERPNRSIICGPNHSTFPSKLKLTFTNP